MLFRAVRPGVAAIAAAVLAAAGCSGAERPPSAAPADTVVTSTTKIASAGVLGNQRRPDESCLADPAPRDGPAPGPIRHAAGTTPVRPDPLRIAVLAGDELDALCALGLQTRIVAAALPDGSPAQPSYLGTVIHDVPAARTRSAPDLGVIAAAKPDLILGSQALTPAAYGALTAIAPTVFSAAPGELWQANLRMVGAATGRLRAADELIDEFGQQARKAGEANDATHFQASVVQLTDSSLRVWGAANFPASVLAAVGVDRPAAQRFTDKPYVEIALDAADFSAADGDIIYLSFASREARNRATGLLEGQPWRNLSANRDNRVFVVNNEVWQTGQGLIAARGIIDDLRWLNAPIN